MQYVYNHLTEISTEVYARSKDYDLKNIEARRETIFESFKEYILKC